MAQSHTTSLLKRVHCIGVGGIGVSAVAKLLKARGVNVTGSDGADSDILRELKSRRIKIWMGSHPEKMGRDLDLVIYSSAVPEEDEERVRARHLGVREVTYNAFLGELAREYKRVIAVTGTHGKSTTTALLGHILIEGGANPTVIVGSKVQTFKAGNVHIGGNDVFIAEACEHQAHMLELRPHVIVLTNIEFDHPDYYRDVDHVRETMKTFVEMLPEDGVLVWNTNDEHSRLLVESLERSPTLVGVGDDGDLSATVEHAAGRQTLHVHWQGAHIGDVTLRLPGEHNVMNALMASAAGSVLGMKGEGIKAALESFPGLWRRFEHLGMFQGADVYADYAHHPTALERLLEGTRTFLPDRRIVLCFQPHQHARTLGLLEEFAGSMDEADAVILPEIYGVAGRNEGARAISSEDVAVKIEEHDAARHAERTVAFAKDFIETERVLKQEVRKGDVLLMVGAGDIDVFARSLVTS